MHHYQELRVWQESIDFVERIYHYSKGFPKEKSYGLTQQMRRAAVSIPSNIAEGSRRYGSKEFLHFLHISLGSNAELETQIFIAKRIGLISGEVAQELHEYSTKIGKMLTKLSQNLRNKISANT